MWVTFACEPPTSLARSARSVVLVTTLSSADAGAVRATATSAAAMYPPRMVNASERMWLVRPDRKRCLKQNAIRRVRLRRPRRCTGHEALVPQHQLGELAGEPFDIPRAGGQCCARVEWILEPIVASAEIETSRQ